MRKREIKSFKEYLDIIDSLAEKDKEIRLFRGQSKNFPLLPTIARNNPRVDTTKVEIEMLNELKRRTRLTIKTPLINDWDWLIYAQHFGMKTRLLDWTSNPLTALWFACSSGYEEQINSYVYIFNADHNFLINHEHKDNPFQTSKTKILRPSLNNERIIAQAGWFTAHKYSNTAHCFVKLESNPDITDNLVQIMIPARIKGEILKQLSIFGINSQVLYPDITGVCKHLNWMYEV